MTQGYILWCASSHLPLLQVSSFHLSSHLSLMPPYIKAHNISSHLYNILSFITSPCSYVLPHSLSYPCLSSLSFLDYYLSLFLLIFSKYSLHLLSATFLSPSFIIILHLNLFPPLFLSVLYFVPIATTFYFPHKSHSNFSQDLHPPFFYFFQSCFTLLLCSTYSIFLLSFSCSGTFLSIFLTHASTMPSWSFSLLSPLPCQPLDLQLFRHFPVVSLYHSIIIKLLQICF